MIGRAKRMSASKDEPAPGTSRSGAADSAATVIGERHCEQVARWYLRSILSSRRKRGKYFGERLFAEPAWDILLHLYSAELEARRRLSVESLADAAQVPASTAVRWIGALEAEGLVSWKPLPVDAGRTLVNLSEAGRTALGSYFRDIASGAPPA